MDRIYFCRTCFSLSWKMLLGKGFLEFCLFSFSSPLIGYPIWRKTIVQLIRSVVSDSLQPHKPQHARPPCPTPTPGVHPTHVHWVGDAIQPSDPLSPPSPPALNLSQHQDLFKWVSSLPSGGQSIGVSASKSILPMNTQDWSPLGWIGLFSLQSKGLSRVFYNTTVQKHQFFGAQLSF